MKKVLAVLSVLVLGAAAASANSIGLYGSYWDTDDADDGFGGGAKIQVEVVPSIYIEARGGYFPEFGGDDDVGSVDIIPIEVAALVKLPAGMLALYGGVGGGYYMFEVDSDIDIDVDDELGYFVLGGVEIPLTGNLAIFGEAKYTWLEATVSASDDTITIEEDSSLDGLGGNAGILLKW